MKIILFAALLLCFTNALAHSDSDVPDPMNLAQLTAAFGWDLDKTEIKSQKVADGLYVLFGAGGNIAVSVGEDGVFIVDDQFPQLMPKIKAAIADLGGGDIDFAVTTHWHFDHAEGNLILGPEDTWLVAHENSREMMKDDHIINLVSVAYDQKAYPESAWPDITFDDDMQFHYNGQQIDLVHFGPAHTTGDAAVIFRGANAVHMGDVFNMSGYPFIDAGNGGEIDGVIEFCEKTLGLLNKDSVVIPGHGPVADYPALQDYTAMLTTIRDRMKKLIGEGASLESVIAAKPTAEFDEKFGDPARLINRAYHSLSH